MGCSGHQRRRRAPTWQKPPRRRRPRSGRQVGVRGALSSPPTRRATSSSAGATRIERSMSPPTRAAPLADLRMGGSWTPGQRLKNDALWAIAWVALGVARALRLGLPALRALGRALGVAAHALAP